MRDRDRACAAEHRARGPHTRTFKQTLPYRCDLTEEFNQPSPNNDHSRADHYLSDVNFRNHSFC